MEIVGVAAVATNGVIGAGGEIPWPSVPADREQYRSRVADHPVILGRRTFESMVDDLPGRLQIVLSRSLAASDIPGVAIVGDVESALEAARASGADRVYVLGGGAIYDLFMPHTDRLLISRIPGAYDGDTRFPAIAPGEWKLVDTEAYSGFRLEEWRRTGR